MLFLEYVKNILNILELKWIIKISQVFKKIIRSFKNKKFKEI